MLLRVFIVAAVLLPGLHAISKREAEEALLDLWLKEQMTDGAESQETYSEVDHDDDERGFASPGHAEEQDLMTAFFLNENYAEAEDDDEIGDYLAEFNSATTESENVEDDDDMGEYLGEFDSATTELENVEDDDEMGEYLAEFDSATTESENVEDDDGIGEYLAQFDSATTESENLRGTAIMMEKDNNEHDLVSDFFSKTADKEDEELDSWLQGNEEKDEDYDMGGDEETPKDNDLFDAWLQENEGEDNTDEGEEQPQGDGDVDLWLQMDTDDDFDTWLQQNEGEDEDVLPGPSDAWLQDEEDEGSDDEEEDEDEAMNQFTDYQLGEVSEEEFSDDDPVMQLGQLKCHLYAPMRIVLYSLHKALRGLQATRVRIIQNLNALRKLQAVRCVKKCPSLKCKAVFAACLAAKKVRAVKIALAVEALKGVTSKIKVTETHIRSVSHRIPVACRPKPSGK